MSNEADTRVVAVFGHEKLGLITICVEVDLDEEVTGDPFYLKPVTERDSMALLDSLDRMAGSELVYTNFDQFLN